MLWGFRRVRESLHVSILFAYPGANHPSSFSKTKGFPYCEPTYFFLFLSAALELSLSYFLRDNTGVGEVTQTPVHSPAHFPAGILPGSLSPRFGRHSVMVLLQSLMTGIHLFIMLLLSAVIYLVLVFPWVSLHGYSFHLSIAGISADQ